MKSRFLTLFAVGLLAMCAAGCYHTVEGRTRAGLPLAKDRVEGRYERPVEQAYAAARKVLEYNGTLRHDDSVTKTLEARIDTRYVWVKVDEIEPNLTRVTVQPRTSGGGGDIYLAAEIEKQIALQLAAQQ